MTKYKMILSDEDFRVLIEGGVVIQGDAEVVLSDIGYPRMQELLSEATSQAGKFWGKGKPREKWHETMY